MASAILSDLCPRSGVSSIAIQEKAGKMAAIGNGKLTDFKADDKCISFSFTANALPWVLPPEAQPGYDLLHAGSPQQHGIFLRPKPQAG